MKKILFALSFFMMVGVAANAQAAKKSCAKGAKSACCAKKSTAKADVKAETNITQVASAIAEADIVADADENIKTRVCDVSGTKAYYQKSVCEKSGTVAWDEVKFCTESKKFTKVASASMEKDVETGEVKSDVTKKKCTAAEKAACAKKCTAAEKATCAKKKASSK